MYVLEQVVLQNSKATNILRWKSLLKAPYYCHEKVYFVFWACKSYERLLALGNIKTGR